MVTTSASRHPTARGPAHRRTAMYPIKNRPPGDTDRPAEEIISPDALALVRFGLRAADDPRMIDTVKVIDAQLRCDLPQGPLWYRYNGDGYGEHEDGAPFDGTARAGLGRCSPANAPYELAAGRMDKAASLLAALEGSAGLGGLLPEQVWDGADLTERELLHGHPSGSAMPLVWAHSEHIKLLRSLRATARSSTLPPQGVKRTSRTGPYRRSGLAVQPQDPYAPRWARRCSSSVGFGAVRWSTDKWRPSATSQTAENAFGIHVADLPTASLPGGTRSLSLFSGRHRRLGECRLLRHVSRAG